MSRNKETANYGELDFQLMRCMDEIKHKPEEHKEYNISKFAQILLGDEYIKELRKDHREEEWKGFWRPYIQRVLEVYAPDGEARRLLLAINGFLEEYRKLGIEQRYEKYAKEVERISKTIRNREDKAIELVVKKLYNEIQENDRRELKLLADEVFAALDRARLDKHIDAVPDDAPHEEWDKRKFLKWLSEHIVVILILLVIVFQRPGFREEEEFAEEDKPEIISFSVMNPDISLTPGGRELINVNVYPDEADKNKLNTFSENQDIAWTENLLVIANEDIQDNDEHLAVIKVQVGKLPNQNVNVTVKKPEPVEYYSFGRIGEGTDIDNGGGN